MNNWAGTEGGGVASQGFVPYFKNSTIRYDSHSFYEIEHYSLHLKSNNVAMDGGGVLMQVGMPGTLNKGSVVPDFNEGVAFNGCNISLNSASGIGGGMFLVSGTPWSLPNDKSVRDEQE